MFFYVYPAWKSALRYFFFLIGHCLFGGLLLAGGGPVKETPPEALLPPAPKTFDLNSLLSVRTEAEEAALAAYFSEAGTMSETGDDLRKLAALSDSVRAQVDSARAVVNKILTEGRQIANLLDAQLSNLPLGITQQVGGMRITLAIAEARILPSGAEVDLVLGIDFPDSDYDPIFKATGIPWSRSGGFVGEVTMQLIADWAIPINAGKSALFLHASDEEADNTFVRVNCEGFVAGRITASFILSRDWVLPVGSNGLPRALDTTNVTTASGNPFSPDRVRADFVFDLRADAGFFGETMLSAPFVFTGREDFIIDVGQVAVDFSDAVNPTDMQLPPAYTCAYMMGEEEVSSLWKGVYLRDIRLTMPSKFRREQGDSALVVGAPYIIIDRQGFTAHIYVANPLPLGSRRDVNWDFSVDYVSLKIVANQFQEAEMEGLLQVPLLSRSAENCDMVGAASDTAATNRSDCLLYRAVVQRGNQYYFGVETQGSFCANIWQAQLEIRENSRIDLVYADDEFTATATLYGAISVNASVGESMSLEMDGIGFENVVLSTGAPYFSPGSWSFPYGLSAGIGPFTIGFNQISLVTVDGENTSNAAGEVLSQVALKFQVSLEMDTALELDARGAFRILGTVESVNGRQKYRFNRVKLDGFSIEASTSAFEVSAALAFYEDHPSWGSGFYGAGSLFVTAMGGAGIAAVAQFGQKNGERYFFVDVMARFSPGIPLGGMNLMAAGGGVYKGMTRADGAQAASFENIDDSHREQTLTALDQGDPLTGIVGISTSGLQYVVNPDTRFGAFIQVVVADASEKAFSVNGRLELEIYETNGWRANIACNITIMGPINYTDDYKLQEGVAIYANIDIRKDSIQGLVFRASADVFVSLAGGSLNGGGGTAPAASTNTDSLSTGSADDFLAGDIMTKYAGGVALLFSRDDWFIHIGSTGAQLSVPNSDLPSVSGPIGLTARLLGDTVGVSAYFCIGTIVPPLPPLPPEVLAITGQLSRERDEQMLANAAGFGMGAHLRLNIEGSAVIVYWRLQAGVGFDINVRNYGGLQCSNTGRQIGINGWYAGGQAYAYLDGEVGVQAPRFLGGGQFPIISAGVAAVLELRAPNPFWGRGTVAGRFRLLGGLFKGSFRAQVEFGELCEPMVAQGEDPISYIDIILATDPVGDNVDVGIRPSVDLAFSLEEPTELSGSQYQVRILSHYIQAESGGTIALALSEEESAYRASFLGDSYLAPNTNYAFHVSVAIDKCANAASNGQCSSWQQVKVEADTAFFTTGAAVDSLRPDNIRYTYPIDGMTNLYPLEHNAAYVQLERHQSDLSNNITAVFTDTDGNIQTRNVSYNQATKRYNFSLPTLANETVYQLTLYQYYGNSNQERDISTIYYRTSQYNRFQDKINALLPNQNLSSSLGMPTQQIGNKEGMDIWEIEGSYGHFDRLVQLRVQEGENYTLVDNMRANIFDALPFTPLPWIPTNIVNQWAEINPELPYDAVYFTMVGDTSIRLIRAADFQSVPTAGTFSGGKFVVSYPNEIVFLLDALSRVAEETARAGIADILPSGGGVSPLANNEYRACFPSLVSVIQACGAYCNPYNLYTVLNDLFLPEKPANCFMEELIYRTYRYRNNMPSSANTTYPILFKYVLPDGTTTAEFSKTFRKP